MSQPPLLPSARSAPAHVPSSTTPMHVQDMLCNAVSQLSAALHCMYHHPRLTRVDT